MGLGRVSRRELLEDRARAAGTGRIHLKGVGSVRCRAARRGLRGTPKTLTVRREGNRWRITVFCADVPAQSLEPTDAVVGIDVGVSVLVATSEGVLVADARHLRRTRQRLAAGQRMVAGRKRGSGRRAPRPNEQGGHDRKRAAAKAGLNREILAAGWGQLLRFVAYKAEEAGRETIAVNPRHTSQTCAERRHVDKQNRDAEFCCRRCGHGAHADVNAARNILRAGLAQRHEREADQHAA